jgi:hypothetical protein
MELGTCVVRRDRGGALRAATIATPRRRVIDPARRCLLKMPARRRWRRTRAAQAAAGGKTWTGPVHRDLGESY